MTPTPLERWKNAVIHLECHTDGIPFGEDPRVVLDRQIGEAWRCGEIPSTAPAIEEFFRSASEATNKADADPRRTTRFAGTALFVIHGGYRFLVTARHVLWDDLSASNALAREEDRIKTTNEMFGQRDPDSDERRLRIAEERGANRCFERIYRVPTFDEFLSGQGDKARSINIHSTVDDEEFSSHTFSSERLDLAVLSLDGDRRAYWFAEGLKLDGYVPISTEDLSESACVEGDEVFTVGIPGALTIVAKTTKDVSSAVFPINEICLPSFAFGRVSMVHPSLDYFWCDMSVYPGNSGGPVVAGNKLLGIVSKQATISDETTGGANTPSLLPFAKVIKAVHITPLIERQRVKDRSSPFAKTLEHLGIRKPDIVSEEPDTGDKT